MGGTRRDEQMEIWDTYRHAHVFKLLEIQISQEEYLRWYGRITCRFILRDRPSPFTYAPRGTVERDMTHRVAYTHRVAENALAGRRGSRRVLERIKRFLGCLLGWHSVQTEEFLSPTPSPPQRFPSSPPREASPPPRDASPPPSSREESPPRPRRPRVPARQREKRSKKRFDAGAGSSYVPPSRDCARTRGRRRRCGG